MADPTSASTLALARSMNLDFTHADLLMRASEFDRAAKEFERARVQSKGTLEALVLLKIQEIGARRVEKSGDLEGAYHKFVLLLSEYESIGLRDDGGGDLLDIVAHRDNLARLLGIEKTSLPVGDTSQTTGTPRKRE